MNARSLMIALLAASLFVFGALAAGCGDEGGDDGDAVEREDVTQDEFFARLDALYGNYQVRGEELGDELEQQLDAASSEDERVETIRQFLEDVLGEFELVGEGIARLNPPIDFRPGRVRIVEASREAATSWRELLSQVEGAGSQDEARQLIEAAFTAPVFERAGKPCFIEGPLGVDIECPE